MCSVYCSTSGGNLKSTDDNSKFATLHSFVGKTQHSWQKDSFQYTCRVDAVRDMLIRSGYPITIVDEPYFKDMTRALDPKFVLPG